MKPPPPTPRAPLAGAPRAHGGLKLIIDNPRRRPGIFGFTWRILFFLVFMSGVAVTYVGTATYVYFSRNLPKLPERLGAGGMRVPSQIYGGDDRLLADFPHMDEGRRLPIPYAQIPNLLVKAFVAAEDNEFFDHGGISLKSIARAFMENVRAGRVVQGGSTITQQVAKTFLSREKKLKRKIREAILARHIEARFSKEAILEYYLNNILLGHGASGVQAAAQNYFGKNVYELNLAEMSALAALPRCPSQCNPVVNPKRSREQQETVLERMLRRGFISEEQRREALATPLKILPRKDLLKDVAPYFAEHARREVERRYNERVLFEEGWKIYTTVDLSVQALAQAAVDRGIEKMDRKQGYRGAHVRLRRNAWEPFLARAKAYYGDLEKTGLVKDRVYLALVVRATAGEAEVKIAGVTATLPLEAMRWAKKPDLVRFTTGGKLGAVVGALHAGDVIDVKLWTPDRAPARQRRLAALRRRRAARAVATDAVGAAVPSSPPDTEVPAPLYVQLHQDPGVRAALYAVEPESGYVTAMVGGYDFDTDQLNRAYQSCRPPGSVFKGIYYSAALEKGYSVATPILDVPKNEYDPVRGTNWKPANYDGEFRGEVPLKSALTASMNNPSIKVFEFVGIEQALRWARSLGIMTPIAADKSSALGSSCVKLWQISNAFGVYSQYGRKVTSVFIKRIVDRNGVLIEDHSAYYDPFLDPSSRIDRLVQRAFTPREQLMDPANAWLMTHMLQAVATYGTGYKAKYVGKPVAGKTGTTNSSFDAWFVGYSRDVTAGVWIGHDRNDRALGPMETGGHTALPIWLDFMKAALRDRPQGPFSPPANITFRGGVPYRAGTENNEYARSDTPREGAPEEFMRDHAGGGDATSGPNTGSAGDSGSEDF
jgi:penicillin-binding protein 1A